MSEPPETRLRRLRMRSWRRGTKEMDLILGGFSDACLDALDPEALDAYEQLLEENDQDLYDWVSGRTPGPDPHGPILSRIRSHAGIG